MVVCCPKFDPKPWDNKVFSWKNKRFIKGRVFTLFFMPINFGSVITDLMKRVALAKATNPNYLFLAEHSSMWGMDLYLAVNKTIPNASNTSMSGKFLSRVYEGDFSETGKWTKDFEGYAKKKKLKVKKMLMWYTTCPKCAKVYGKNFVVIIGKI